MHRRETRAEPAELFRLSASNPNTCRYQTTRHTQGVTGMKTQNVHKTTQKRSGGESFLKQRLCLDILPLPRYRFTCHARTVNSLVVLCSRLALKQLSRPASARGLLTVYVDRTVGFVPAAGENMLFRSWFHAHGHALYGISTRKPSGTFESTEQSAPLSMRLLVP